MSRPLATSACLLAQAHAPGELQLADGEEGGLAVDARPFAFGQHVGQGGDALLVLDHAGGGPHRLPGAGDQWQGNGLLVGKDPVHGVVQVPRQAGRAASGRRPRPRRRG